jgi:hypothetical protein
MSPEKTANMELHTLYESPGIIKGKKNKLKKVTRAFVT